MPLSDVFIINKLTGHFERSEDLKITLGKCAKHSGLKLKHRSNVFRVGIQSIIENGTKKF